MKKIFNTLLFGLMIALLTTTTVFALYNNGDFETGDFTGWTKSAFINRGFSTPPRAGGSDLSAVVGGPDVAPLSLSDPNTGGNLKYPAFGHYSARINSELSYSGGGHSKNANTISQTIPAVLDPADGQAHVRFTYSAVMVNPIDDPHTNDQKPYFRVQAINTSNGNDVLYDFSSFVGEPGQGWKDGIPFGNEGDLWQYLDWTNIDLASSATHPVAAGDMITLKITAAGCSLGGHPGYVYVDNITDSGATPTTGISIQASGPATATAGSPITYTYNYRNDSGTPVDLSVVINPPANVSFTTLSDPVHCTGTAPVTCNFTGVATGSSGSFTVTGDIAPAAAGTTLVLDNYTISATGFPTVTGSPVLTVIPLVPPTNNLTLSASGAATVKPGDQYVYTLSYTVTGTFNNAQVSLTLPGHTTFVSSDQSCSETGGVVTCDLGPLAASGSFNITVLVDKLKKVSTTLTLPTTAYSITAANLPATNGLTTVTAEVLTPFTDVPAGYWALDHIQSIWAAGITSGCSGSSNTYCPAADMIRAEMAVFIERGIHGGSYIPPVVPLSFADTAGSYQYWIEALKADGITAGCGGGNFCPNSNISRAEMAIFLLRGKYGSSHVPPAPTGLVWVDVPVTYWAAAWAEELGTSGISAGCGQGRFCPDFPISRDQTAVLVQRTFGLPLPTP